MSLDTLIYIGRFQPPHNGHITSIRRGLALAEQMMIFIGSHEVCRSQRNPFTTEERIEMLQATLSEDELKKIRFVPIHDSNYKHREWIREIKFKVRYLNPDYQSLITGIMGHKKDGTSYYLDLFPEWSYTNVPLLGEGISAEEIRRKIFEDTLSESDQIPEAVYSWLNKKKNETWFKDLKEEYRLVQEYRKEWACAPYPPVFVAGDACVVCSEHILLIKRGAFPGKGLYALPGGFLEQNEEIEVCATRELIEETGINMSFNELRKSIINKRVFDDPNREPRGRMISHTYLFNLRRHDLPELCANDDASDALWFPLKDLQQKRAMFAGDHYKIINCMLNLCTR